MAQIEKEIKITYRWWTTSRKKEIKANHVEALNDSAMERITRMMRDGYTSGQLNDTIRMDDNDGKAGIEYRGWWGVEIVTK